MGLETKFYVDIDGNYLGGFSEYNEKIPKNAIEVSSPPPHGWQKYFQGVWLPLTEEQKIQVGL